MVDESVAPPTDPRLRALTARLTVLSAAGAALFFGVFLWLIWSGFPPGMGRVTVSDGRRRRAAVGLLAALALANGYPWLTLFVHTSIAAGMMLRGWRYPEAEPGWRDEDGVRDSRTS